MNKDSNKLKALFEGFSIFAIIILLIIIVLTSLSVNAPLFIVLLGFSPTLITIIIGIIISEELAHKKIIIWIIPFILSGLFFYILTYQNFSSYNMKVQTLTAINIFFSLIYLIIFALYYNIIFNLKREKDHKGTIKVLVENSPKTISEYVSSIEDKSKALNFVIGRVYSIHKGGTKSIREKITVPSELYNEFSDLIQENKNIDEIQDKDKIVKAVYVTNKIEEKLRELTKTEAEVFGNAHKNLKNLERNPNGTDKILDVLIKNDKDPVESYYKGAIEFCRKLKEKLNNRITFK